MCEEILTHACLLTFYHFPTNDLDYTEMKVTQQEMADALVPIHVRDYCAHILIPLNQYVYHIITHKINFPAFPPA